MLPLPHLPPRAASPLLALSPHPPPSAPLSPRALSPPRRRAPPPCVSSPFASTGIARRRRSGLPPHLLALSRPLASPRPPPQLASLDTRAASTANRRHRR
uniref:Uncharacterized protein n=1 Tax=Oryza barthii TaxID=65489 RepID=A0A0D3FTG7_9ORYZ